MPKLLNSKDVMDALGVSESTLYRLIRSGAVPRPIKLSRQCNRWREADIEAALEVLRPKAA